MNFDEVLENVGGFGRYQKYLSLVFLPVMFAYTSIYCGQIFFAHTPEHWCRVPQLDYLPQDVRRSIGIPPEGDEGSERWSQCTMYDLDSIIGKENHTLPTSLPIIPCKYGWEYDFNSTFPTIVSDMNWVCNDSWRPAFGQASFFVGATVGSVVLGAVADKWGRVPSLVAANAISAAAGIATAFIPTKISNQTQLSSDFETNLMFEDEESLKTNGIDTYFSTFTVFTILRFLTGLGYDACYMMAYICILEYVDTKRRALMANLPFAVFLTMALVAMPWVAYAAWDWRLFSIVICIPILTVIFAPVVVPESSRWLLSRGKYGRAEKILKKVAKVNGKHLSDDFTDELREMGKRLAEEAKMNSASTVDLFRNPCLRKRVLLMLILWVLLTIVYDGHIRNVENLGSNIFLTFCVTGVVEAPACMLPAYTLDRFGRRPSFGIPLALSGVSYLIILAFPRSNTAGITALAVLGRLCVVSALNSCLQFFVELLPTRLRGQGTSFVHVAGHMASLASPLIVHLVLTDAGPGSTSTSQNAFRQPSCHHQLSVTAWLSKRVLACLSAAWFRVGEFLFTAEVQYYLPFLILGLMGILGGGLAFLLPETAHQPLPETVEDIENFKSPVKKSKDKNPEVIYRPAATESNRTEYMATSVERTENSEL